MAAQAVETNVEIAGIEELKKIKRKYDELKEKLKAAQDNINEIFHFKYKKNSQKSNDAKKGYRSIVEIIEDIYDNKSEYVTNRIDFDIIFSEDKINNVIAHLQEFVEKWETVIHEDNLDIPKKQANALKVKLQGRIGRQSPPLQKAIRQIDGIIVEYTQTKTRLQQSLNSAIGFGGEAGAYVRNLFNYSTGWGGSFFSALTKKSVEEVRQDAKQKSTEEKQILQKRKGGGNNRAKSNNEPQQKSVNKKSLNKKKIM